MKRLKEILRLGVTAVLVAAMVVAVTPNTARSTDPMPCVDLDNPARNVWTWAGYNGGTNTVPDGQTLVIEEIGGLCGNSLVEIAIDESSAANRGTFWFNAGPLGGALAQRTRIYVRSGQVFTIRESPDRGDLISLHGYLITN